MEIILSKADLQDVFSKFNRISDGKLNPILGTTLFEIDKQNVTLTATNIDIWAKTTLLASTMNDETFAFCIDTAMMLNCINKISGEDIKISLKDKLNLSISCGRTRYSLVANSSKDFPEFPKESTKANSVKISADNFFNGISSIIYCVSERTDLADKRQYNCVNVSVENGTLSFKGIDGYRSSEYKLDVDYSDEPFYTFIPKKTAKFILDLAAKCNAEEIEISKANGRLVFKIGEYNIVSNTITADNFDFTKFQKKKASAIIKADTKILCQTIEQAIPVIENSSKNPLRLNFNNDSLNVTSVSTLGKSSSECKVALEGESLEIGFNSKYLLEAIKNINADKVIIKAGGPLDSFEIYNSDNENIWSLVLPMRLKGAV